MTPTFIFEILDRVLRSWWTVVAGVCIGLAGGMAALDHLPKTYQAGTTIFVAPKQVPQEFVRSTVTEDMSLRLSWLRDAVMSRRYLLHVLETVYGLEESDPSANRIMGSVRSRVSVDIRLGNRYREGGVFKITYRDNEPQRAADVVNALADFYIEENVRFRTAQAEDTTRTLEQLTEEARVDLETKEREIAAFKSRHLYDTQEHFSANLTLLQSRQADLKALERDRALAQDRLETLLAQQAQAIEMAGDAGALVTGIDPIGTRLAVLQREYADLRTRYHDNHPDVRAKKREIDEFRAAHAEVSSGTGELVPSARSPLQVRIDSTQREIARLAEEETRIRQDLATFQTRIENTPRVEQQLAELTKGLEVLRRQYEEYRSKTEAARGSQRVEESQKGERFEIVERAGAPSTPISPVPLMIYGMGVAIGLTVFVGPVLLRAILIPTLHSSAGVKELGGVPVLVSIPRLDTPEMVHSLRFRRIRNLLAAGGSATVLVAVALYLR